MKYNSYLVLQWSYDLEKYVFRVNNQELGRFWVKEYVPEENNFVSQNVIAGFIVRISKKSGIFKRVSISKF